MYHLAEFGPGRTLVIRDADGATIPDDPDNADWQAYDAWMEAGNTATMPPAAVMTPQSAAIVIQEHVDAAAKTRGYADGVAVASYATSTNAAWAAEAATFIAWRDAVWTAAYSALASIQSGTRQMPTRDALIAELPTITW